MCAWLCMSLCVCVCVCGGGGGDSAEGHQLFSQYKYIQFSIYSHFHILVIRFHFLHIQYYRFSNPQGPARLQRAAKDKQYEMGFTALETHLVNVVSYAD